MFSQNTLVQFVFANERDSVFWDSIFRADLDQYLFCMLHKKYSLTYFIDKTDGKPSVRHFGDQGLTRYKHRNFLGVGGKENQLAKWMLNQLKNKEKPCAMIARLEVFCELFESEDKTLKEIAEKYQNSQLSGTIVLVVSHNSDKNFPYLMKSPVFDYLQEESVLMLRGPQKIDNIYSFLETSKQSACVFLNSYTRDRITALVTRAAVRDGECYPGKAALHIISNYLTRYLNSPEMQMKEHRLFERDFPILCPPYQEIYRCLTDKRVWKLLCDQSQEYAKEHPDELSDRTIDHLCRSARFIYNDNSIQTKCMKLCTPDAAHNGIYDSKTIGYLSEIFSRVRSPANRSVNPKIAETINGFMARLNSAQQNGDKNTCSRIVVSILFCVRWLTSEIGNESVVLKKISDAENFVGASAELFYFQRQNGGFRSAEQKKTIEKLQSFVQQFDDTFHSQMLSVDITVSDAIQNLSKLRSALPVITAEDVVGINIYSDDDE